MQAYHNAICICNASESAISYLVFWNQSQGVTITGVMQVERIVIQEIQLKTLHVSIIRITAI